MRFTKSDGLQNDYNKAKSRSPKQRSRPKISPEAGKIFDIANRSDQPKATLYAAIIGATALVFAARMSSSPNLTVNLQPVVERIIEGEKPDLKDRLKSSSAIAPPIPRRKPKPPR